MKYIACICFLVGSGGFGFVKVVEYRKRYRELVYIKYILNMMLVEIENHRETFGETCLAISDKVKEPYKEMFAGLYGLLEREREEIPEKYWKKRTELLATELMLTNEEKEILFGVIRCADCNMISMPLDILRQTLAEWDKVIIKAEEIKNERSKVTLTLSIAVGLILCITVL